MRWFSPDWVLGVVVARARRISTGMIATAANAVAELSEATLPGASLLPRLPTSRRVSAAVAVAVALAAAEEGLAQVAIDDPIQQVHQAMWRPYYPHIEAVGS